MSPNQHNEMDDMDDISTKFEVLHAYVLNHRRHKSLVVEAVEAEALAPKSTAKSAHSPQQVQESVQILRFALQRNFQKQRERKARIRRNTSGGMTFNRTVFMPMTWARGGRLGKVHRQQIKLAQDKVEERRLRYKINALTPTCQRHCCSSAFDAFDASCTSLDMSNPFASSMTSVFSASSLYASSEMPQLWNCGRFSSFKIESDAKTEEAILKEIKDMMEQIFSFFQKTGLTTWDSFVAKQTNRAALPVKRNDKRTRSVFGEKPSSKRMRELIFYEEPQLFDLSYPESSMIGGTDHYPCVFADL